MLIDTLGFKIKVILRNVYRNNTHSIGLKVAGINLILTDIPGDDFLSTILISSCRIIRTRICYLGPHLSNDEAARFHRSPSASLNEFPYHKQLECSVCQWSDSIYIYPSTFNLISKIYIFTRTTTVTTQEIK